MLAVIETNYESRIKLGQEWKSTSAWRSNKKELIHLTIKKLKKGNGILEQMKEQKKEQALQLGLIVANTQKIQDLETCLTSVQGDQVKATEVASESMMDMMKKLFTAQAGTPKPVGNKRSTKLNKTILPMICQTKKEIKMSIPVFN